MSKSKMYLNEIIVCFYYYDCHSVLYTHTCTHTRAHTHTHTHTRTHIYDFCRRFVRIEIKLNFKRLVVELIFCEIYKKRPYKVTHP